VPVYLHHLYFIRIGIHSHGHSLVVVVVVVALLFFSFFFFFVFFFFFFSRAFDGPGDKVRGAGVIDARAFTFHGGEFALHAALGDG
jgi:hypothetical protein